MRVPKSLFICGLNPSGQQSRLLSLRVSEESFRTRQSAEDTGKGAGSTGLAFQKNFQYMTVEMM